MNLSLMSRYRVTGESRYLAATEATARSIIATEINAAGSGAAFECWYHGAARETEPAYHMMETCVTTTWMRLCQSLLRHTGDSRYADQLELTFYNAFLASMARDGAAFSKYCPLEGKRGRGENQCRMNTNCCVANGPRGFVAFLETLVMTEPGVVIINGYSASQVGVDLPGGGPRIEIVQETLYPGAGGIQLDVIPAEPVEFILKLRIPQWSTRTTVQVNGQDLGAVKPGAYVSIPRRWQRGDRVVLNLDMEGQVYCKNKHFMIRRGPITLARDRRFADGDIHEVAETPDPGLPFLLAEDPQAPEDIQLAFVAKLRLGSNLELADEAGLRPVHFCDFASAGNSWRDDSLYRVWQRVPLNVTQQPYVSYNP